MHAYRYQGLRKYHHIPAFAPGIPTGPRIILGPNIIYGGQKVDRRAVLERQMSEIIIIEKNLMTYL